MLRARAPVGQALGGRRRFDGHEAFPLQALEHRERRRQQFTLLAVVPTPTCDRRLDGGDQELGRRPSVTRFHRRRSREPFIQKSPEPSAPTRSPTTDSIRAKLIPGDSDDIRRSYSRWLSPTPRGRPLRIQIKPRRMREACLSLPTYLAIPRRSRRDVGHVTRVIDAAPRPPARTGGDQREWHAGVRPADRLCKQPHGPTVLENLIGKSACRVASGSPASNSVMTITRCRRSSSSPLMTSLPIK